MRLPEAFDAALPLLTFFLVTRSVDASAEAPRYLVYPPPASGAPTKVQLIFGLGIPMEVDVSTIVGYVMKCNYNLPYNASYLAEPYVRYQRSTAAANAIDDMHSETGRASSESGSAVGRYEIYKMLESAKPCLLRAICEVAATPLNASRGLAAQLLHIFLTPSSTSEPQIELLDQEYLAAEKIGRLGTTTSCIRAFPDCNTNLLDYISQLE